MTWSSSAPGGSPLGWVLVLLIAGWNGMVPVAVRRHRTGCCRAADPRADRAGPLASRNPLYVGMLALYVAVALLAPTFWGLVLFLLLVLLVRWGDRPEELFLHERFGALYDDHTQRVRRWL